MSILWTAESSYEQIGFEQEADLEAAVCGMQDALFGSDRLYFDLKKKIYGKQGQSNIPDGYLLDLSGKKPKLYFVEHELAEHPPTKHVAVQLLEFSLCLEARPRHIRDILLKSVQGMPDRIEKVQAYAERHGFRNIDHVFDYALHDTPFAALVIIDSVQENLEMVLDKRLVFDVEILELQRFRGADDKIIYHFEPFLSEIPRSSVPMETMELDTIVVPARPEGFQNVFLGEDRWHAVRVRHSMRHQIKHIAGYQISPKSAITHVADVKSMEEWDDSGKLVINFESPARPIDDIVAVRGGRVQMAQGPRYANLARLQAAKTLDEVW